MADKAADREARLQDLAAALIHRFNNVLMAISPHVEVIKRAGRDNDRVLGSATQIETALKRAKLMMSEVSRLAHPLKLDLQPVAVDDWFDSLRKSVQPFSQSPVDLAFDAGSDLTIAGDRGQLSQAIANLVTNAVESMPNGGAISVTARAVDAGIEFAVSDNGTGVAPEMLSRVFEPLFTTKRNSAGMGLAVVQQIVEAHGGTVRFDSKSGEGTTVSFVVRRHS